MTIIIDSNEHRNHPEILPLLTEQGIPCDVGNINKTAGSELIYPDFLIFEAVIGINRKTVGEWLSNSEKVIEQIQRELAGPIRHLALIIEGVMKPWDGVMYGYDFDWKRATVFNRGLGQEIGTVPASSRRYSVNPKHVQNEQTRLEFAGVQVIHTYSLEDTVSKLVAFHDLAMKGEKNNILSRLIKPDINVRGLTPQETKFARQLMSFDGVGEQAALTLAATYSNIMELIEVWQSGGTCADLMLRGGTRRIGTALEQKIQRAIGYESSGGLRVQRDSAGSLQEAGA